MLIETTVQTNLKDVVGKDSTIETKKGKITGKVISYNETTGKLQSDFPTLTHEDLKEDLHIFISSKDWSNPESITYKDELTKEQEDNLLCTEENVKWKYTGMTCNSFEELIADSKQLGEEDWEMINFVKTEIYYKAVFKKPYCKEK